MAGARRSLAGATIRPPHPALVAGAFLFFVSRALGGRIRVPGDFMEIQAAIDAAADGDAIVVDPGTYVLDRPIQFKGKAIELRSRDGPEATILRMADSPADPGRGSLFIFDGGETPAAVLRGFTLAGGKGTDRRGGAIYCTDASPRIVQNIFADNVADLCGGAIYAFRPVGLAVTSNRFVNNHDRAPRDGRDVGGGAIFIESDGRGLNPSFMRPPLYATIEDNEFMGNASGRHGGAIAFLELSGAIRRNRLSENRCDGSGGAVWVLGGGTHFAVEENAFLRNAAQEGGGAISLRGVSSFVLKRNDFLENRTAYAGGGAHLLTTGLVEECVFSGNRAGSSGGGIFLDHSRLTVRRCIFSMNDAGGTGGAIRSPGWPAEVLLIQNTVVGNRAEMGGGGIYASRFSSIVNSIVWGNEPDDVLTETCGNIWYSILGRTKLPSTCESDGILANQGNVFEDPRLRDPGAGDFRLLADSPGIDAGDPAADPDPDGSRADIGAIPFSQRAFVRGDVDDDGSLGLADAVRVLEALFSGGTLGCKKAADVDDDGRLTVADGVRLLNFLFAGGPAPPAPYPDPGRDPTPDPLSCG